MAKVRVSQHSGREGSANHNDRSFLSGRTPEERAEIAPHIREEDLGRNMTWCWKKGESFEEAEIAFYEQHYGSGIEARNERYREERHPERCKTVEDVYRAKQTRPEEVIVQIGNREQQPTVKDFLACVNDLFRELQHWNREHGSHMHILDIAIHVDEATPHAHIRRVWDYTDGRGELHIGQAAALRAAGIQRPDMTKPAGRYNNEKITFDAAMRERWQEICRTRGFDIETEARVGVRHKDKAEFIADKLQQEIEERQREISAADQRITDQKDELAAQDRQIEAGNGQLAAQNADIEALDAEIASKTGQISALDEKLVEKENRLKGADFKLEHKNSELEALEARVEKVNESKQHAEDQRLETLRQRDAARKGRDVEKLFGQMLDVIAKNDAPQPPTVYETIPERKGGFRKEPRPETVVIAKADLDDLLAYRRIGESGQKMRDEIQKAVEEYKKTADLALMNKIDYTRLAEDQRIASLEKELDQAYSSRDFYEDRCRETDQALKESEARRQQDVEARWRSEEKIRDMRYAFSLCPEAEKLVEQTRVARRIEQIVDAVRMGLDDPAIVSEPWGKPKYLVDGQTYTYTGMLRLYEHECQTHNLKADPALLDDLHDHDHNHNHDIGREL